MSCPGSASRDFCHFGLKLWPGPASCPASGLLRVLHLFASMLSDLLLPSRDFPGPTPSCPQSHCSEAPSPSGSLSSSLWLGPPSQSSCHLLLSLWGHRSGWPWMGEGWFSALAQQSA